MNRRRASDDSLNSSSFGATSDADEKKNKMSQLFRNLIPKRRKPKMCSLDDAGNIVGGPWFSSASLTRESEGTKDTKREEIIGRTSYGGPLPHSVGSLRSDSQPPKPPPRRRKHPPPEKPTALEGSSLDEVLSPVGSLHYPKQPVIYSRTSSHSSGFEEGSSSLTETSDASTWKDLIPRITDRVHGWSGESVDVRATPANHPSREMESGCNAPLRNGRSGSYTTCDEDIQVFSPEISLSVDEVLQEYFATKDNLLASFTRPQEHEASSHSSSATVLARDARLSSNNDLSDNRGNGLTEHEYVNARTSTDITRSQEPKLDRKPDQGDISEPSISAYDFGLEIRSSLYPSNPISHRFLQGDDNPSHLFLRGANESNSCNVASQDIERTCMEAEIHERDGYSHFKGEAIDSGEVQDSVELFLNSAVPDESKNTYSPPSFQESWDVGQSTKSSSPEQKYKSLRSSSVSTTDKDSLNSAMLGKGITDRGNLSGGKTVTSARNKPPVPLKPRSRSGNMHGSGSQSFQSPRGTKNDSDATRSLLTESEARLASGRRRNVSFIVNDDDFGRYLSKPHGIEDKMVLPYTERQELPDLGGNSDGVTSFGKSWMERHFSPPPRKPTSPGTSRQVEPGDIRFEERRPSVSESHQSVSRSPAVTRWNSDRRDRSTSEVTGAFGSNQSVDLIAAKDAKTDRPEHHDIPHPTLKDNHARGGISSSADDYLETSSVGNISATSRDKCRSVARVSARPRDLSSEKNSVSSETKTSCNNGQYSPATRISSRPRGLDSESLESPTVSNSSRIGCGMTRNSTGRLAGTQPLRRHTQEVLFQPETSQRSVETDLAKKFEAFNARLAAMATAAAEKRSPRTTCSDTGRPFGGFQKGKWMSSDCIFEEGGYDETSAASAFERENQWKSEKLPVFRETNMIDNQKDDLGPYTSRGISRSRSEADDDMKARYHSFLESRSRLVSADTTFVNRDKESPRENQLRKNNNLSSSSLTNQDQRLSSSFADLNRGDRDDEFASRTPDSNGGRHNRTEKSASHRSDSERGLFRSHSRGEYDQLCPKSRKTLQQQGEELQRQFSRWHGLLVSEKSRSLFDRNDKEEQNSGPTGDAVLDRSFQTSASLVDAQESERLQKQSAERTPVKMGTKPIVRRPPAVERRAREISSDPSNILTLETSDGSLRRSRNEFSSNGPMGVRLGGGRPLRRSLSCVQSQTDPFPRLAMAKFNDDGTPKSILKKSNASRSQSAYCREDEEGDNDDDDDDYGFEGTTSDQSHTVSPLINTTPPPPLPSSAPPDLPPYRQTTQPPLIPSYLPLPPQSPNLPASPPPSLPSSQPPSSPSQTRTSPSFPPPLPTSSPPRFPSSSLPPIPPRRPSSFRSPTLPPSPLQPLSKSLSPQPLLSSPPVSPFPISPSATSPGSDASNSPSAWSPDSSSKFIGLQNLQKRTAFLKMRSRSDLGVTASMLAALNQQ